MGVFKVITPNEIIECSWGKKLEIKSFHGIYFERTYEQFENLFGKTVVRNIGIFPESPMYDIGLITALFSEIFLKKKPSWIKSMVIIVTIITTFGTLAIMLSIFGLFLAFCSKQKFGKKVVLMSAIIVILFLIQIMKNILKNMYKH